MAVLYGVLYLSLTLRESVHDPVQRRLELQVFIISHFVAFGGQLGARLLTRVYLYSKAKNGGTTTVPEMRIPLMVSATTLPIGLLIYGWPVQAHGFWLVPDLGVFIFSIGIGQLHAIYAASATSIAAVSSFRAFAGFGLQMYAHLGDGCVLIVKEVLYNSKCTCLSQQYGDSHRHGKGWPDRILALRIIFNPKRPD
ncbi:hypothetical protein B0H13DRAFT_1867512 [Mycena leptocephala]|nr:hypothetical protein B0H13DRAFT_1867512 [Mycena leptocephala]